MFLCFLYLTASLVAWYCAVITYICTSLTLVGGLLRFISLDSPFYVCRVHHVSRPIHLYTVLWIPLSSLSDLSIRLPLQFDCIILGTQGSTKFQLYLKQNQNLKFQSYNAGALKTMTKSLVSVLLCPI